MRSARPRRPDRACCPKNNVVRLLDGNGQAADQVCNLSEISSISQFEKGGELLNAFVVTGKLRLVAFALSLSLRNPRLISHQPSPPRIDSRSKIRLHECNTVLIRPIATGIFLGSENEAHLGIWYISSFRRLGCSCLKRRRSLGRLADSSRGRPGCSESMRCSAVWQDRLA